MPLEPLIGAYAIMPLIPIEIGGERLSMKVLVTGGTGFIGSYLLRELLREGHQVVTFDWQPDHNAMERILTPEEKSQVTILAGDVTDLAHLMRVTKEYQVDRIVHLASLLIPAAQANPLLALRVIAEGTCNIFEVGRIMEIPRIVWASSIAVFGRPEDYPEGILRNDSPHYPKSVYGACKSLSERLAQHYFEEYGVDSIGLRFTIVYGYGRLRGATAFVNELFAKPALGQPGRVPFGDDEIDWQYVEDVAQLLLTCLKVPTTRTRVFNTQGDVRPMREALAYVKSLLPEADLQLEPGKFGILWRCDTRELQEETGFVPRYRMEEGIRKTINAFRRQAGLPEV